MRKRVLWNAPHVRLSFRISLAMFMTMIVSLAVTGCGGGGGGTPKPPGGVIIGIPKGDPNLATITGIVTDTTASATPIAGAIVKVAGTALQGVSGTNGKFAIINVPVQAVGLTPTIELFPSHPSKDDEREATLPHAPPAWHGPDVRDRGWDRWETAWPAHDNRVGPCKDADVCRALRAVGGWSPRKLVGRRR